jgi:hypothetical protein
MLFSKQNALVPKTAVIRKEEGATVDSSAIFYPTFPQWAVVLLLRRAVGQ